MRDTPRVGVIGEELLAGKLLAGKGVPQPILGADAAVGLLADAAGDQRLGVDHLPVVEAGSGIRVRDFLDEGALVDRREQTGAFQVRTDDVGNLGAKRIPALKIGDGDRQRLDSALVDVEYDLRLRRKRGKCTHAGGHCPDHHERDEKFLHAFSLVCMASDRLEHVTRVEIERHISPVVIFVGGEIVRSAFLHRADCRFGCRPAGPGRGAALDHFWPTVNHAGAVEMKPN